jgi:phosphatidylglycerophosphatase C
MGTDDSPRQSPGASTGPRPIVAFDFDGTLTVRDSFMDFLRWRAGPLRFAFGMARLGPSALAYVGHRDRGRLKARAVREFLKGESGEALAAACETYAAGAWLRMMRPDALATWQAWKDRGALMTIVTASPETLIEPFARRLGADVLLGTRLAFGSAGRVEGAFAGENCRALEKVVRLRERFGPEVRLAAAYGDTSGDADMLQIAEVKGYREFTGRPRG